MTDILVPRQRRGVIRKEGTQVHIILEGRLLMQLSWQSALELAKELGHVAHLAEEEAKAEQIIQDQAILHRAGVPVGLVTRKDMALLAAKEAAWNSRLRRFIRPRQDVPQGIVYAPRVTQSKPEPNVDEA